MTIRTTFAALLALTLATSAAAQRRPVTIDDQFAVQDVAGPELSPDGEWVTYTLTTWDVAGDKRNTDLWKVRYDGSARTQLTFTPENETSPKWSPDGRFLAFLSSRPGPAKGTQVWLLPSSGGEARQLTRIKGGVTSFEWAPDSRRLALVRRHGDPNAGEPEERGQRPGTPPPPFVLDAYQFKRDGQTYLTERGRSRISLFDVETQQEELLTADANANGPFEESSPSWSPDGTRIAFVSNHDDEWDRTRNDDVFVVEARAGSKSRRLTTFAGRDGGTGRGDGVVWSPDGRWIAYGQGSEPRMDFHSVTKLAVVAADGSAAPRLLTADLDRSVSSAQFSADGASLVFTVADDRTVYLARVSADGGRVERLVSGQRVVGSPTHAKGRTVVTAATSIEPAELYAFEGGALRKLTTHNEAWLSTVQIQPAEDIAFKSSDGADIRGLLTRPVGYVAGQRYPTLLRLHGGPTSQDAHTFNFERQIFAANGYAVVNVNYRGSSGRGAAFQESIFADWGNLEVKDVLAAADHVVANGIADPNRLGVGGWSYGGVLTDYVIASDTRFKAAISGAGSANHISLYGHDQYTYLYDSEFGPPWENLDLWVKYSYPFFKANRITTPTLFMGGQNDFNVPILGSEQMYQALKTLRVPTQLVVYPGQNHSLTRVPYLRDRLERYLAWYGRYLQPTGGAPSTATASSQE